MARRAKVLAHWDPEAKVWVATSHDIKGLVLEAPDEDKLVDKLQAMVPELLMANFGEITFEEMSIDYTKEETVPILIPHDLEN